MRSIRSTFGLCNAVNTQRNTTRNTPKNVKTLFSTRAFFIPSLRLQVQSFYNNFFSLFKAFFFNIIDCSHHSQKSGGKNSWFKNSTDKNCKYKYDERKYVQLVGHNFPSKWNGLSYKFKINFKKNEEEPLFYRQIISFVTDDKNINQGCVLIIKTFIDRYEVP